MKFSPLTIIILLSFIVTGCALNQPDQPTQVSDDGVQEQTSSPALAPSQGVTDDDIDTSDWKVYENEELGVRFRYPGEFQIEEQDVFSPLDLGYNQNFWDGKSLSINLKKDDKKFGKIVVTVMGYTSQYKNFYYPDRFDGNVEKYCQDGSGPAGWSVCIVKNRTKYPYVLEKRYIDHECSPSLDFRILFPNPNKISEFNALVMQAALQDSAGELYELYNEPEPCGGGDKFNGLLSKIMSDIDIPYEAIFDTGITNILKNIAVSVESNI